jgi:hypothetical protein
MNINSKEREYTANSSLTRRLIFPVALKTIIIKYSKYNFKQYIHIHNEISQSEYNQG